jgi:hypothetical protein
MPDCWFLLELEEDLNRHRPSSCGRRIAVREIVEAVVRLREQAAAADRKRVAGLKRAEAAEQKRPADLRRAEPEQQRGFSR